jgi:hypothetical protein
MDEYNSEQESLFEDDEVLTPKKKKELIYKLMILIILRQHYMKPGSRWDLLNLKL